MFKNNLNRQNRTFKNIRELFPHYLSDMKNAAALQMGHRRAGPVTDFFLKSPCPLSSKEALIRESIVKERFHNSGVTLIGSCPFLQKLYNPNRFLPQEAEIQASENVPYFPPPPGCRVTCLILNASIASAVFAWIVRISATGASMSTAISFPNVLMSDP